MKYHIQIIISLSLYILSVQCHQSYREDLSGPGRLPNAESKAPSIYTTKAAVATGDFANKRRQVPLPNKSEFQFYTSYPLFEGPVTQNNPLQIKWLVRNDTQREVILSLIFKYLKDKEFEYDYDTYRRFDRAVPNNGSALWYPEPSIPSGDLYYITLSTGWSKISTRLFSIDNSNASLTASSDTPTSSHSPFTSSSSPLCHKLTGAQIAGIVVGELVIQALIMGIFIYCLRKRQRPQHAQNNVQTGSGPSIISMQQLHSGDVRYFESELPG